MIISCGEALIDFITAEGGGEWAFTGCPGGSPYNTAIAMARQGQETAFLGRVSDDLFGKRLKNYLDENSVRTDMIIHSCDHSTLSFVKKDQLGQADYAFFSENTADRSLQLADLPDELPPGTEALIFGSISLSQEPCGSAWETFLEEVGSGCILSLDPNIRPSLIDNPEAFRERMEKLFAMSDIVKLSDEDLEWLYPGRDHEELVKEILKKGAALAALTAGKDGVLMANRNGTIRVPIYDLPVADTVGAGDTFHGSLIAYLSENGLLNRTALEALDTAGLEKAGSYASKAAGINCSRQGCDPPRRSEMD